MAAEALLEQRDPGHLLGYHHRDDLVELWVVVAAVAQIEDNRHSVLQPRAAVVVEAHAVDVADLGPDAQALRDQGRAPGVQPVGTGGIDFVEHPRQHLAVVLSTRHARAPEEDPGRVVVVELSGAGHRLVRHSEDLHAQGRDELGHVDRHVRAALAQPVTQQPAQPELVECRRSEPEASYGRLVHAASAPHAAGHHKLA